MAQALNDNQVNIVAAMQMIAAQVMDLAPEPGGQRGFVYASADSRACSGGDDFAGGLIADAMISVVTGMPMGGLDAGHAIDAIDEVYVDRAKTKQQRSNAFSKSFGSAAMGSKAAMLEKAFEADLPKRVQLERQYMILANKLDETHEAKLNFDLKRDLDPDLALERHHKMGAL